MNYTISTSNFTFEYDKGLQESRRLLEIESNLESKVMVAEDLVKTGNYNEGREYALRVLNETPQQAVKLQSILRLIILSSYFLEGKSAKGNKELHLP